MGKQTWEDLFRWMVVGAILGLSGRAGLDIWSLIIIGLAFGAVLGMLKISRGKA